MSVVIYHNPRCSKSRQTLELLRGKGVEPEIREYLKTPPSIAELKQILGQLGLEPHALMRTKEARYKELDLGNRDKSADLLIRAMHENPILIERPIVVSGDKAALGRPPEAVLNIL
ncbi:arsenate reductase (glutaredoxin) [Nisaea sp.]|uniref:arsenate reductase (glutaredoxin) n=1 Tax=Nisaea sp. TaxID=2024842 RepID=UPI003B51FCC5